MFCWNVFFCDASLHLSLHTQIHGLLHDNIMAWVLKMAGAGGQGWPAPIRASTRWKGGTPQQGRCPGRSALPMEINKGQQSQHKTDKGRKGAKHPNTEERRGKPPPRGDSQEEGREERKEMFVM